MRGIAVMVVFIMHVTEVFVRLTPSGRSIYQAFYDLNLGRVGVVTFFAVSGFLVPSSLFGKPWSGSSRFLIARVFRLYPAYLLSIIPSVLTYQLMTQGQHISPQDALLNLTMVPRLFGAPMANGAYWTLEVELAFYAVCLFLFLGGVLSNSFVLAALMAGLFFLFYTSQRQLWGGLLNPSLSGDAFFFSLHLACMFWGAVIRRWWSGERLNAITYILVGMFSSYWLILLPAELLVTTLHPAFGHMDSRLVFGYSLGLWLFVIGMSIIRIRMRAVIWFGRISYSFYLLHQAGLYVVYWLVLTLPVLQGLPMPLYVLAALACSTGLAAASFSLVEAPFVRLGRALTARLSRSPSHPPLTC
jgi:peptidoglycan/LPS O-acetylase OafA/YrhL